MNPEEYEKLASVEDRHWFYSGKREIILEWLRRCSSIKEDSILLDIGAGTGLFAKEVQALCRVIAIDDHEETFCFLKEKIGSLFVVKAACTSLPFQSSRLDFITALDVLEHVHDDRKAVLEMARVLRPGGIVGITVPALPWLWSDWDEALHHVRRYTRQSLLSLFDPMLFSIRHWNYVNVIALPAMFAVRALRRLIRSERGVDRLRMEDRIPPEPLNGLFRICYVGLACQRRVRFPVGAGLLLVAQRR